MKLKSIRAHLRWLIIGLLAAILLPLGIYSYQRTSSEVNELLDGRLGESASTLELMIQHVGVDSLTSPQQESVELSATAPNPSIVSVQKHSYESEVGLQVYETAGKPLLVTANMSSLAPPRLADLGFHDLQYKHHPWRMFTLLDSVNGILIRVGERYDSRHDINQALWIEHGLPLLLGLPLLAILIGWAVRRGLRPMDSLATALATRSPGDRQPIVLETVPLELEPVVTAMNEQLERLEDALERERRFSADVAHELRTPLAATMIHLESVSLTKHEAEKNLALSSAHHALSNLTRRVEQLLAVAKMEAGAASQQHQPVDLVTIVMDVIDELATLISESGIALSLTRAHDHLTVMGNEAALSALVRNLVENALRHVPPGGQIEICLTSDSREAIIDIIDNGPGIPLELRGKMFLRFQQGNARSSDGYGLGLSIVQRAAQLHHANIELLDSPLGTGLRVRVGIPTGNASALKAT